MGLGRSLAELNPAINWQCVFLGLRQASIGESRFNIWSPAIKANLRDGGAGGLDCGGPAGPRHQLRGRALQRFSGVPQVGAWRHGVLLSRSLIIL